MTDSLAMRSANAATGFVLSSLLVCGVIVVSEPGTYALPIGSHGAPVAEDARPGGLGDPGADTPRPTTGQSITVPVKLRAPRDANARGAAVALPASAESAAARPDQRRTTNRSGEPDPGRESFTSDVNKDQPERDERGSRTSSRRGATSSARTSNSRDTSQERDTSPDRRTRTSQSADFRERSGRGA
ncbi:hypothetical protein [Haloechinothrix halophila]|uniref:hypothetical protein n=1 Tax=Haloechinothrix halophila TaxID=1069073 RepID=UPI00040795C7|nr:hypothetical protein [Haloechinothrix halophila]